MDILDQTSPLTEKRQVANDGNRIVAYLIDIVLTAHRQESHETARCICRR
jgi:hypothetical protein